MYSVLKKIIAFFFSCACLCVLNAQDIQPVSFSFTKERITTDVVLLTIKAKLKPGVKLYALEQSSATAIASSITFDTLSRKYLQATVIENNKPQREEDTVLKEAENYYLDSATWQQKAVINITDSVVIRGVVNYMYKEGDEYKAGEQKIIFFVQPATTDAITTDKGNMADKSLLWIFLAAFGGGLLALLTPCVYSMIPLTVSFFTKRSKTKKEGIRNAVYYAVSIIVCFTLLGLLSTLIFGPAKLNNLATNWLVNLLFFALFIVFGFSFLGAFEIRLPSSWTNKSDSRAGTHSLTGIFFMALTLVLVSFSCTGPIIGNLLVLAAKGSFLGPLVGMFGFSIALALPFALFAFFPGKLNVLGKAGGWLNVVKITLGFLEIALALKFFSNADLIKGWRLLDREVFISLWVVIFILLGIYLLGKLKFNHDDELPKNEMGHTFLPVSRLMIAIISLAFAVYMIPGLWGAPLKAISAFLPPMGTQDMVISAPRVSALSSSATVTNDLPHPIKYYDKMKMYEPEVVTTYGMVTYYDYDEALAIARKLKKPLMLDFTGINCVNCRKMEGQVWSDAEVMKRLKDEFVIASLYVDVQNIDLQENEQYFSKSLNKQIETLGDKNADMQVEKFGANSQPYYFFIDAKENKLLPDGYGYDPDTKKFIATLDKALANYKLSNQQGN